MGNESMSSGESAPVDTVPPRLISLCKEFTGLLLLSGNDVEKLCAQLSDIRSRRADGASKDVNAINVIFAVAQGKILAIQPAIDELARAVSQQIEHADLEFADQLEMKLRLAVLEAQMQATAALVSNLSSFMK